MNRQTTQDTFLTQNSIKNRGWTVQAIRRFLGDPDRRESNRLLWRENRVEEVERSGEFRAWQIQREIRLQRLEQRRADAIGQRTFAKWHPPEPLPAPDGFYETIAQIRQTHTYLIGRPILPGKPGEAIIECTKDQYSKLAEQLHIRAANHVFGYYNLRISMLVI